MTGAAAASTERRPTLSIIVPLLNEIELLPELLAHLQSWQRQGCEILLVDGGSDDGSADVAESIGFTVLRAPRGRALQMNAGAARACGDVLVFLHADTRLSEQAGDRILNAMTLSQRHWGRFDVRISGARFFFEAVSFAAIACLMNLRSRLTGIATGDQTIFVSKSAFESVGGFPEQPLMEDIELCRRLRRLSPPACLRPRATTSGRRWLTNGIWQTVWLMWRLRWRYWRGVPAERLIGEYR